MQTPINVIKYKNTKYLKGDKKTIKKGDKTMEKKAHLSLMIPLRLMKDLKIMAIEKETTLTKLVSDILQEYIQENK